MYSRLPQETDATVCDLYKSPIFNRWSTTVLQKQRIIAQAAAGMVGF